MLGKTNITTIEGGTIVSDIEDYSWDAVKTGGITSSFVKVIYDNNTLAAITKDGTIVHSKNGEVWEIARLNLEEDYELNDFIWDGSRYVIVGSCMRTPSQSIGDINESFYIGMFAITENLKDFIVTFDTGDCFSRYLSVIFKDGKYMIVKASLSYTRWYYVEVENLVGSLDSLEFKFSLYQTSYERTTTGQAYAKETLESISVDTAKNSKVLLAYLKIWDGEAATGRWGHRIITTVDGVFEHKIYSVQNGYGAGAVSVFECKDSLYYCANNTEWNYEFDKIIGTSEKAIIKTNINFSFVDAVYFNKREIYINDHQMLIIKQGENLADKTIDDLIDITYDFSMCSIVKAFDGLYIFGTDGNILVSSDEVKNEEAIAVKTMSASKALYDANAYTDKKYAELEARIELLENKS